VKKSVIIGLVAVFLVLSFASSAYCDDMIKKFGRGICNIITCPLEFLEQIKRVNNADGPAASMTVGVLKGIAMTVTRGVVGVYEVVLFPVPIPKDYGPVLTDPEFFFEETIW